MSTERPIDQPTLGSPVSLPQADKDKTTVGNYFVSNYPPFSIWQQDHLSALDTKLNSSWGSGPNGLDTELGLYVHIPFCRKRCHFCYFKVYTDKNKTEIADYLDAVLKELDHYLMQPYLKDRKPTFIYFGGGTPSYLSPKQLTYLFDGLKERLSWENVREVAFECEPGTLTGPKLEVLKELGVTRLSLGVENLDDHILEVNGRAHRTKEIDKVYPHAQELGFDQINIDLIAGMLEETQGNWNEVVRQTVAMAPDCVTIYQMEVPYNTTIYKQMKESGTLTAPVADWPTKRQWVNEAFDALMAEGYTIGSAYTAIKNKDIHFEYRDRLWEGHDLLSLGVASFGHLGGVHYQNEKDFGPYIDQVSCGNLPRWRAYPTTSEDRLIREFILRLKLGRITKDYYQQKFNIDVGKVFRKGLDEMINAGAATETESDIIIHRSGLLEIDRWLHGFFDESHLGPRYV